MNWILNINVIKLNIERDSGILHLKFKVSFPCTDIYETFLITNYETIKEFLIFIKFNVRI